MSERLLVTSALPYANGPIHLGHMVEHIQTDVYVRFRRSAGDQVTWICAADAHGTPIEVNAGKAGVAPEAFAEGFRREHQKTFAGFAISHDTYYTTHSPENRRWAYRIYDALKAKGLVYKRSVEQLYCARDQRFLPDRFVKGTCPKCGTADQYGDVCERCGTTYDPRELKGPLCVLCGTTPEVRQSDHAYVNLRKPEVAAVIRSWVEHPGHLEPGVRAQVRGWLDDLQDWCITRDAPYFGFPVNDPDFPGKFLYVWVDAPIGYLSSAEHYFAEEAPLAERLAPAEFERRWLAEGTDVKLQHFIGKDILRFHAVFWPAMLWAAGIQRPDRMPVHGHLTVNGEKMSKSRGTFIDADTYLAAGLDPELLRYFLAASLGPAVADLDMSLEEFRNRVNADLANNVANLASRVAALIQRLGGPLQAPPEAAIAGAAASALQGARAAFHALELREAVRQATQLAGLVNRRMQEARPWEEPGSPASRALLFSAAKALRAVAVILWPVMPRFADGLAAAFGQPRPAVWSEEFDAFAGPPVEMQGKPPQIARLEAKEVGKLIVPVAATTASATTIATTVPPAAGTPGIVTYDDFAKVELRVGKVLAAEAVPRADKLLKLQVDVGEGNPRTIVAGIALAYPDPGLLVGRSIVVVANLAPRALRGISSQGMLLAAGEAPNLQLVSVGEGIAPGTRVK
jgi:methionyl-tRNA synthetase